MHSEIEYNPKFLRFFFIVIGLTLASRFQIAFKLTCFHESDQNLQD